MKLKNVVKSAISLMLCASMVFVQAVPALADGIEKKEPVTVQGTRLSEEELPEESIVYFGTTALTVKESETIYRVPLFREGTELPEEDVTLHTMDLSALYGKDYELIGKNQKRGDTKKSILELLTTGEENEALEYEITVEGDDFSSYRSADVTIEEKKAEEDGISETDVMPVATPSDAEGGSDGSEDEEYTGKSRLALLKEEQTGKATRETESSGLSTTLTEALWNQIVPEVYSQLTWSCEQKIHFEEGQKEAVLEIRILSDHEAEGSENFSVTIVEAEATRPYGAITLSVMISDDEGLVYSVLTLDKENYITEDGAAEIQVSRHESLASLCTAVLKGENTSTGEETTFGEVVFMPYEETKAITLNIEEETRIFLCDLSAAVTEETSITEAVVFPEEKLGEESENYDILTAGEDFDVELQADIEREVTLNFRDTGKSYKVKIEKNKQYGIIYDERYTPAVEVGIYVLPSWFSYGIYEGSYTTDRNSEYRKERLHAGFLHWYHSNWSLTGASCATLTTDARELLGIWYQTVAPNWEQDTDDGNCRVDFSMNGKKDLCRHDQFDLGVYDNSSECIVVDTDGYMDFKLMARDTRERYRPDTHLYFYGIACMYKHFRLHWAEPDKKDFRAGNGTESAAPLQFYIDAGVKNGEYSRDIFANINGEQTNLVVTTKANIVNGEADIYGKITGYQFSVTTKTSSGTVKKTYKYPEDYVTWYGDAFAPARADNDPFGISRQSIDVMFKWIEQRESFKKSLYDHLNRISYDENFLKWLGSMNIVRKGDGGKAYYQEITVTPIIDYINVDVKVLLPEGTSSAAEAKGKFASEELAVGTYDKGQFHAGDKLDLSGTTIDDKLYEVIGYQYSTDGGSKFNTITDSSELLLRPNLSYVIRPVITERTNGIEVVFEKGSESCLALENAVIPQSELQNYPKLKGHTYLNLNPEADSVPEKIRVIPGKAYTIKALVMKTPNDTGSVYRPVFKDSLTQLTYNGQSYSFIGRQNPNDNMIRISTETVKKAELKTCSLEGYAVTSLASIRNDALGKHETPAFGYAAQIGNGQEFLQDSETKMAVNLVKTVFGTVDETGLFTLQNLTVKTGDRLSVLLTNGDTDSQVFDVKVQGNEKTQNIGKLQLGYPYSAPRVVSLTYSYGMPENDRKVDLTDNLILVMDDQLVITAQVDTRNRNITKAVFRSVTTKGQVREYTAYKDASNPGIYKVTLPKLTENFYNGEKLQVYLVEEKTIEISDKETTTTEQKYPVVQTGFAFCTKNVQINPKTFDTSTVVDQFKEAVDIPLLGNAVGKLESGKLDLSRTDWPNGTGYSITVGLNAALYQSIGSATTAEKKAYFDKYMGYIRKATCGLAAQKVMQKPEYKNDPLLKKMAENGQNAKAEMNKKATVTFNAQFLLDMEFVKNPTTGEYVLAETAVTVGGSGTISKTFYSTIGSFPCYINLSGSGDVSLTLGGTYRDVKDAITQGEFGVYEGNLADIFDATHGRFFAQTDLAAKFKASAGVGVCGVLGARGYVAFGLQFQSGNNPALEENVGFVLSGDGGIGLDFLVGTFDVDIIHAAKGFGSLAGQTSVTMFNGLNNIYGVSLGEASGESFGDNLQEDGSDEAEKETETGELTFNELEAGAKPAGSFGSFGESGLFGATPAEVSEEVLQDNAAQYTRPQLLDLGDGRQFLSFIGASDAGKPVLYYTVCSEDGTWSSPKRVYAESVQDAEASLLLAGDKVYIAWQCAETAVGKEETLKKRVSALDLNLAVYDTGTGTMGTPEKLTDNEFLPINPHLSSMGDEVYCSYTLVDYAAAATLEDYTDFELNYSTPALTVIRDGKPVTYKKDTKEYLERLVTIEHPTITDPLVTDFQAETLSLKDQEGTGHDLSVFAYTVDEDGDPVTDNDKELYLKVTEQREDGEKVYYPIRLTNDTKSDAYPKLTKLGNELYVSWVSAADTFCLMDVGALLSAFFAPDTGSDVYNNSIKDCFAAATGRNWYKKTAAQLGIPETDSSEDGAFCYQRSVYPDLAKDAFDIIEKKMSEEEGSSGTISKYQLASDGRDLYIFYTDMTDDTENAGVELYGFRYQRGNEYVEASEEDDLRAFGFSEPVQITNNGKVHDEISLFMTDDRKISLVSNQFTQEIDGDGKVHYGGYQLVHTSFVSEGSVEIEKDSMEVSSELIPGSYSWMGFTLRNKGLYPTDGFRLEVTAKKDGVTKELVSEDMQVTMDSNETLELQILWEVPENVAGTVITAKVTETGVTRNHSSKASVTVDGGVNVSVYDLETKQVEFKEVQVNASLLNAGNTAAEGLSARLVSLQDYENGERKETVIAEKPLEKMNPGDTKELEFKVDSEKEYYDMFGRMKLELRIMDGETEVESMMTDFIAEEPMVLELNGGKTDIYLKKGETMQITAEAYPWNELAGTVYYAAMDPQVASVTQDGMVKALKDGTTPIAGYSPDSSTASYVFIHVGDGKDPSGDDDPDPEDPAEEDDAGYAYSAGSYPSWVIAKGFWKQDADGTWMYLLDGNPVKNGWFCIYNPYADKKKKQKNYGWFYFDQNGIMLTGWITDADGNRYYLNPDADNTRGVMVSGWRQINGVWYYFSEKEGSGTFGALQRNTLTPDGYRVDGEGVWVQDR